MADINYEELEDLTLTMEDEDGTTTECELQFVFEYDGQDYGAFCEAENETGEFYFFSIDGETNAKGETELEIAPVEDDALLEQFCSRLLIPRCRILMSRMRTMQKRMKTTASGMNSLIKN